MLYGTLCYLCYRALNHHRLGRIRHSYSLVIAFLFVGVYGMSDEFHQSFVPGRAEELKDLLIDLSAAFVVLVGIVVVERIRRTKKQQV
jgi:VanZ family protein